MQSPPGGFRWRFGLRHGATAARLAPLLALLKNSIESELKGTLSASSDIVSRARRVLTAVGDLRENAVGFCFENSFHSPVYRGEVPAM